MFADLDETLRKMLIKDLPIRNGEIEISFEQPKRESVFLGWLRKSSL